MSQQRVRKSRNKSLHLQPAKELCRAYVASVSTGVRRESWDKMHELIGRGGVFSFSFPSVFFFFNSFYFIYLFLPSLKLSRNINLIENTYCTCTGYLVIKKQQRTTNEETGETCSIFRFWIWVGRILWGSIWWNHPKYFARRKALCWVSNHATYQPEALLVWYMHYKVAIACKPYYNNDACKCNEFREWPSQQTIV